MRRTQIQLDEATYELLRRRAFEQGVSISALVREALREHLSIGRAPRRLQDFISLPRDVVSRPISLRSRNGTTRL